MLTLYYFKQTAALAPHILLEYVGAEYETKFLDLAKGEQKTADYLAINPKGRVPALKTPEGILTETPAILAYIAQTHPEANVAPKDLFAFAQAQSFNNYLNSTVHVNHAHKIRGIRWSDDEAAHTSMKAKVTQNMTDCAAILEQHFLKGPFVLGDNFSMCDPYLFLVGRWLKGDGVDVEKFPKLLNHYKIMLEQPAVAKVFELHS